MFEPDALASSSSTDAPQPPPFRPGPHNPWIDTDEPPRDPTTNGFAVASIVLGLVGVFPLAITFAIIALVQIGEQNQQGRKYAIGGLVASGVWLAIIVAVTILIGMDQADRDEQGRVEQDGWVDARELEVGDCLVDLRETDSAAHLDAVPCSQPHEGEVYGIIEPAEGAYPGEEAMLAEANQRCSELLWAKAPDVFEDPTIELFLLYPHEATWRLDRTITCVVVSANGLRDGTILGDPGASPGARA